MHYTGPAPGGGGVPPRVLAAPVLSPYMLEKRGIPGDSEITAVTDGGPRHPVADVDLPLEAAERRCA